VEGCDAPAIRELHGVAFVPRSPADCPGVWRREDRYGYSEDIFIGYKMSVGISTTVRKRRPWGSHEE
jgi:hypothetical protein